MEMNEVTRIEVGEGRTRVDARLFEIGPDLLVVVGGEGRHVGAASIAEIVGDGGPSLESLSIPGHRERELTDRMARELAKATGRRTLALAGIHLDRIRSEEIEAIRRNVTRLIQELAERWRERIERPTGSTTGPDGARS